MKWTLSIETPGGSLISVGVYSLAAANEIERLLDNYSDCKTRRPVSFREIEREIARKEAIKRFHVERGCCDGTFRDGPCTYKIETKERQRLNQKEFELKDLEAFRGAELER